jgi:hypothetical protein
VVANSGPAIITEGTATTNPYRRVSQVRMILLYQGHRGWMRGEVTVSNRKEASWANLYIRPGYHIYKKG